MTIFGYGLQIFGYGLQLILLTEIKDHDDTDSWCEMVLHYL